ncbi:MAG TPA: C40 family peptidase [Sphingobacteriaceae bacterium]|nr:C40 family peptidase [Sphingobacteriaceae bacterium]
MKQIVFLLFFTLSSIIACDNNKKVILTNDTIPITGPGTYVANSDTIPIILDSSKVITPAPSMPSGERFINTGRTTPGELITYAKTLTGIPYKYGSIDPRVGFDCSGFITNVFNHFNITVPRPSVDYTNIDRPVDISDAKQGDLILFTGTDSLIREVGHMGIIVTGSDAGISFIHSTSGKANGVTITPFNNYYQGRFVKVIRIFPQNE